MCWRKDPDAKGFAYWVVHNIPGSEAGLTAGLSNEQTLGDGAYQGVNSFGKIGYGAPCPPRGSTHHYEFFVYVLDAQLGLGSGQTADQVAEAISGHVTAWGMMTITLGRQADEQGGAVDTALRCSIVEPLSAAGTRYQPGSRRL